MKLFKTTDMQVVSMCREHFDFVLPSVQLDRRRRSFVGCAVTTDLIKFVFAWCFRCCILLPWFGELKFLNSKCKSCSNSRAYGVCSLYGIILT